MNAVVIANEKKIHAMKFECQYCKKSFVKETTLMVHVCEKKKRYQSQNETGIQIGLRAYQKFYAMNSVTGRPKSFDDFADSPYYRAFARFGQYCVSIRAINILRFVEWLLKNNKRSTTGAKTVSTANTCRNIFVLKIPWMLFSEPLKPALIGANAQAIPRTTM
jgi:hypothetical protein